MISNQTAYDILKIMEAYLPPPHIYKLLEELTGVRGNKSFAQSINLLKLKAEEIRAANGTIKEWRK